jgi:hypothetical protein
MSKTPPQPNLTSLDHRLLTLINRCRAVGAAKKTARTFVRAAVVESEFFRISRDA